MKMHHTTLSLLTSLSLALHACVTPKVIHAAPPTPYGAIPTPQQVAWHEMEMYAFVHFAMNTFTDVEWGYGDESPLLFNPTDMDVDKIVAVLAETGFTGVILTCKHHEGFCLWPTETTDHNIAASPYKDGQGDLVREFADAAKKHDLKFGVYVSPWDRNNKYYGKPEYVSKVFRPQIKELLTNYGDVFTAWFDGANGGDGYYGGARDTRNIDRTTYYNWDATWKMVNQLAPNAVIFSDIGPGCRWIGNEKGIAGDPCWATFTPIPIAGSDRIAPGEIDYSNSMSGTRNGKHWIPGEADVSIRPGWFYHPSQNDQVRSPANLMDLYMQSVGRGANFLLNVPPDRRGQIHENDVASLTGFGQHLRATFKTNLASAASLIATNIREGDKAGYGPEHLIDDDRWSAWITDDDQNTPSVEIRLPKSATFNLVKLREDIRLGQRVEGVAVDAWINGTWEEIAVAQSIGACRLWRVPATTTDRVRLRVTASPVCPALSDFGLYLEPEFVGESASGVRYLSRSGWTITASSESSDAGQATRLLDGDPTTLWNTFGTQGESGLPQHVTIDLSQPTSFDGLPHGTIDRYRIEVSNDGETWHSIKEGEFGNIRNNPIEQEVRFEEKVEARYVRLTALRVLEMNHAVLAEVNLLP
jgi:alpha-L-fucosidase